MNNDNALLVLRGGFKVSPYLGEKITYIGQLDTYEMGSEIAARLLHLQISDTRIFRMTDTVGEASEEWLEEEDLRTVIDEDEVVYAQVDGSMILTREVSWKETKLGRIFGGRAIHEESDKRKWLKDSEYVAHLGTSESFVEIMSDILDKYEERGENLVFINDGAKWQWNWATDYYPRATQILDFYHAMEHIGSYVSLVKKGEDKSDYLEQIGHTLKHEGLTACRAMIDRLDGKTATQRAEKAKLDTYLDNNAERMNYPQYLARGLLIGSGAIESAHRTVIQRRMKLSGQRWSIKGASNMLNLRTLNMSGHWDRVSRYYRNAA